MAQFHTKFRKELYPERRSGKYNPSEWRFREPLEFSQAFLLGNVLFELVGLENLLDASKTENQDGARIIGSSHLTDVDVSVAAAAASQLNKLAIPVASTNLDDRMQRLVYRVSGVNTYPVPYHALNQETTDPMIRLASEQSDEARFKKGPKKFDWRDYINLQEQMNENRLLKLVTAAHNPTNGLEGYDGTLDSVKPGLLVPHMSLAMGEAVLPALTQIEGQALNPNQNNNDSFEIGRLKRRKTVRLSFGEPIKPDWQDVDNYQDLLLDNLRNPPQSEKAEKIFEDEQRRRLRKFGAVILDSLRDLYDDDLADSAY